MTEEERQMSDDAMSMILQAIHAVDPETAVRAHLSAEYGGELWVKGSTLTYSAQDYDQVFVVSFGKASSAMAKATTEQVRQAMPEIKIGGIVIVKDDHATLEELESLQKYNIDVYEASHPIPDERSQKAAEVVLEQVSTLASERTLVICCISGGGSALFCNPKPPLFLQDLQITNSCLLACGMAIQEINIIRKRLEDGKGGWLAAKAWPSTVLTLVLSDILGDPLDLIASGPTVPDSSTWKDAWELVEKYKLNDPASDLCLPESVLDVLKEGLDGKLDDTPTSDHPIFATKGQSETVLVGNNELAVMAAANEADRLGYYPVVLGTRIEGEAKEVAGMYIAMAQQLAQQRETSSKYSIAQLPAALIGGGETTVTLSSSNKTGKGGRNQELALAAALGLRTLDLRNVVVASAGTDGTDGPTDAAGAIVDGGTVDRIEQNHSLSAEGALRIHNAYNYFSQEDNDDHCPLIMTGPTGTNVADVCVTLIR